MKPDEELRHLFNESNSEDTLDELCIVLFKANCNNDASLVLQKCKEVMQLIIYYQLEKWPSEEEWYKLLPNWFVSICSSEKTPEEDEEYLKRWRQLSANEQMLSEEESSWSVMEWVSWFEPSDAPCDRRYWFWWDAFIQDPDTLLLAIAVIDLPFPSGTLFWLLKASGAIDITETSRKVEWALPTNQM
jgi:hypothetical protein